MKKNFKIYPTFLLLFFLSLFLPYGCSEKKQQDAEKTEITFIHGKPLGRQAQVFNQIIADFEKENPQIKVIDKTLPNNSDLQHQFYVTNFGGQSESFDVLSVDIIWIPEFAASGWLCPLDQFTKEEFESKFFKGAIRGCSYQGKLYGVPWFVDAGLLYYRKDLLKKYNFDPPQTFDQLVEQCRTITKKEQKGKLYGFVWQGMQYEGLVCNFLEYIWGSGGAIFDQENQLSINSSQNQQALALMHDLIYKHKITPAAVATYNEEESRHVFENGNSVFLRNWPYVWSLIEAENSSLRGKVGIAPMPHFQGKESAATLGGWQLGINNYSGNRKAAWKLVEYMTSHPVQKRLALSLSRNPTLLSLYDDLDIKAEASFMKDLLPVFMRARPRPVTPFYPSISLVIQREVSAVLANLKSSPEALETMESEIQKILKKSM
jgi:multiple sugar transport system substrate-binding protein